MRRATLALFLMVALVGGLSVPCFGVISFFVAPLVAALWIAAEVARYGRPGEAVLKVRHEQLLGPGGPDDPFAGAVDDEATARHPR